MLISWLSLFVFVLLRLFYYVHVIVFVNSGLFFLCLSFSVRGFVSVCSRLCYVFALLCFRPFVCVSDCGFVFVWVFCWSVVVSVLVCACACVCLLVLVCLCLIRLFVNAFSCLF